MKFHFFSTEHMGSRGEAVCQMCSALRHFILFAHVPTDTTDVVPTGTIIPTIKSTSLSPRPNATSETAGELNLGMCSRHTHSCARTHPCMHKYTPTHAHPCTPHTHTYTSSNPHTVLESTGWVYLTSKMWLKVQPDCNMCVNCERYILCSLLCKSAVVVVYPSRSVWLEKQC